MASRLLTLPNEVQHLIVSRVPHPTDLKALSLVSKHVSAIATQYLYRDLVLPYSDIDKDWIDLRYLLESRGLQYVRTLTIDSANNLDTYGYCKPLEQLLPKLPLKLLTHLWYGSLGKPTDEGLRYLLHHQDKLTNLQIDFSLDGLSSMAPSLEKWIRLEGAAISSLKSLTELKLNFRDERDTSAENYSELFRMIDTARLKKVSLCANGEDAGNGLTNSIVENALSASLTHINLTNVCIPQSNGQPLQLDNFHSLKHLEIHECTNVASTFDWFRQPKLHSFAVRVDPWWGLDGEDLEAIILFLRRFRSLNRLIISSGDTVHQHEIFVELAHSISRHAESLSDLVINLDGTEDSWNYLSCVLLNCKNLSQVVMPAYSENLVVLFSFIVLGLPRLITLNVINLGRHIRPKQGRDRKPTTRTMTPIAERLFDRIPQAASFSLLAFGEAYEYGDVLESNCKRWCFFRHQVHDPSIIGMKQALPVRIPINQVKYVVPRSDLLDYKFPEYP